MTQLPVLDGAAALQQLVERVRLQKVKGLHHDIGGQMLPVVTYADALHACIARSLNAGDGVLYDDAPAGRCADSRSRSQIYLRIGLASVHIFSGDDALKKVASRQSLKHYLDVRPRRRRSNCLQPSPLV